MISNDYWLKIQNIADGNRWIEQSQAKFDIFEKLFNSLPIKNIETIILPSFNPVVLLLEQHYKCTVVASQSIKYSWQSSSNFVDSITDINQPADIVLALDEYLTYANSEQEQRDALAKLKDVTGGTLVTTLQDYKNAAPHKRNTVDAVNNNDHIVVEQNMLDKINRQIWKTHIYFIENQRDFTVLNAENRRTMYFKQLAKYSSDLNGSGFTVQKNLLYRGFFKRNYEHIITLTF
jgi:hypothetical protein